MIEAWVAAPVLAVDSLIFRFGNLVASTGGR